MDNWKTSLTGVLKVIAALMGVFGVAFSPDQQNEIIGAAVIVYSLISGIQAHFSADKPKKTKGKAK